MKVIELTNVDFSLRHFLLPLMRGIRVRGHEVVGVCAEGPLLDDVRAEGFRVVAAAVRPAHLAAGALARVPRPGRAVPRRAARTWCMRTCRSAASSPGWLRACAGVPRVAYTCHGFLFNNPGPWPRRAAGFVLEWLGGRRDRRAT